jgi:hypothetical protein
MSIFDFFMVTFDGFLLVFGWLITAVTARAGTLAGTLTQPMFNESARGQSGYRVSATITGRSRCSCSQFSRKELNLSIRRAA